MLKRSLTISENMNDMFMRVKQIYDHASKLPSPQPEVLSSALLELGFIAEELQVVQDELNQQSEQVASLVKDSLTQSNYYYRLFNQCPEAHIVTNAEGRILEANVAASQLFNLEQADLQGKLLLSFIPVESRVLFKNKLIWAENQEQAQTWSFHLQTHNGELRHINTNTSAIKKPEEPGVMIHWILREAKKSWEAIAIDDSGTQFLPLEESSPIKNSSPDILSERSSHIYHKGDVIPLHNQIVWQVQQGLVKLTTLTEDAQEVILGLVSSSMPFGLGSSFLPIYQAIAVSDVQLIKYSLNEIEISPQLAQFLLPKLNQRIHQTEALLKISGQRRVKDRLYHLLKLLKQEFGQPTEGGTRLNLRLTHEDIASACGTTRVTITRLLGQLRQQNRISLDRKFHIILSEEF